LAARTHWGAQALPQTLAATWKRKGRGGENRGKWEWRGEGREEGKMG